VAWAGGAPGILDLDVRRWSTGNAFGAPATTTGHGTFGRFRYVAYLDVFMLVNNPDEDVHFYKLSSTCRAAEPPPSVGCVADISGAGAWALLALMVIRRFSGGAGARGPRRRAAPPETG
jgi:hypothetical protein